MKKIYVIQHSFNQECQRVSFFEIVSAHSTKENALKRLEEINNDIESGTSFYFPDTKIKGERTDEGWFNGYTYEWYDDGNNRMFTHFNIVETTLE